LFQNLLHLLQLFFQSAADDLDQPQGPGLNHPLALRDGAAASRGVADLGDVSGHTVALFVPDVDFDSAWLADADKPSHLVEQSWAAGDGLASDDRRHKDTR